MTEEEWLKCEDIGPMRRSLPGHTSKRKLRLFVAALFWSLTRLTPNENQRRTTADKYEEEAESYPAWRHSFNESLPSVDAAAAYLLQKTDFDVAEKQLHASFLRDIFGPLPFRPVTLNPNFLTLPVKQLAQAIYDDRNFAQLPILADLLQEAGCDQEEVLRHLRGDGEHVRGCWVLDLVLGKE